MQDRGYPATVIYLWLADASQRRGQRQGRDRFLVLAAEAACIAGTLEVAEACRGLVLTGNPHHLISRFDSIPAALRSDQFQPFLRRLHRFCPLERAELLADNHPQSAPPERLLSAGMDRIEQSYLEWLLELPHWSGPDDCS